MSLAILFHFLCASACNTDTTPTQPYRNSNTHRTKNNTANVVIQQNSRKLLMMDILISETCWAHKKWNKIASDIKLVLYSSTITTMHGPINLINVRNIMKLVPGMTDCKSNSNLRTGLVMHYVDYTLYPACWHYL